MSSFSLIALLIISLITITPQSTCAPSTVQALLHCMSHMFGFFFYLIAIPHHCHWAVNISMWSFVTNICISFFIVPGARFCSCNVPDTPWPLPQVVSLRKGDLYCLFGCVRMGPMGAGPVMRRLPFSSNPRPGSRGDPQWPMSGRGKRISNNFTHRRGLWELHFVSSLN